VGVFNKMIYLKRRQYFTSKTHCHWTCTHKAGIVNKNGGKSKQTSEWKGDTKAVFHLGNHLLCPWLQNWIAY
jgi:hypothetical protein